MSNELFRQLQDPNIALLVTWIIIAIGINVAVLCYGVFTLIRECMEYRYFKWKQKNIKQKKDLDNVINLWNECLPFDRNEVESVLRLLDSPYYRPLGVFVAERKGKIVGFLPTMIPNESKSKGKESLKVY